MERAPVELWATSRQVSLRLVAYDAADADAAAGSVVVLHGLVTGVDVLRGAVPGLDPYAELARLRLNVLALDWPGHGRSGGRRGHLTYRLAMEAAATAVEVARARWDAPVGLFGTALGGVLAFYAALEDSGAAAVACHNVLDLRDVRPVLQHARQGALLPAAARLCRTLSARALERVTVPAGWVVAPRDLAADHRLVRVLRRHPQAVWRYDLASLGALFLTPDDKPDTAAQRVPTFIAVGSGDRVLPETATRAFASRLTCDAELWVLPGGGHQLPLEHPKALLPAVAGFLTTRLAKA